MGMHLYREWNNSFAQKFEMEPQLLLLYLLLCIYTLHGRISSSRSSFVLGVTFEPRRKRRWCIREPEIEEEEGSSLWRMHGCVFKRKKEVKNKWVSLRLLGSKVCFEREGGAKNGPRGPGIKWCSYIKKVLGNKRNAQAQISSTKKSARTNFGWISYS